jgi:GTP-binding protein LepA
VKSINIAIIAHIDHGKSTFCDAIISICENVTKSSSTPSLDSHSIEKRRGVTIRNHYKELIFQECVINLIDTPGHYDFKQYVNIGIHIAENIILLIDISKGIQAQTFKYLDLAISLNKNVIVVLNKVDLQLDQSYKDNIKHAIYSQWKIKNIYEISAKKITNVSELLQQVINNGVKNEINDLVSIDPLSFIILDSDVIQYKYTSILIKILTGHIKKNDSLLINKIPYRIFKIHNIKYKVEEVNDCYVGRIYSIVLLGNLTNVCKNLTGKKYINNDFTDYIVPYPICLYCQIKPKSSDKFKQIMKQIDKILMTEQMVSIEIVPNPIHIQAIQCGFYGIFHKEIFFDKLKIENIEFQEINFNYEWKYDNGKRFYIVDYDAIACNYRKYLSTILTPFMNIRIQSPGIYYNDIMSKIPIIAKTFKVNNTEFTSYDFILDINISEMDFLSSDFISLIKNISHGYADIIIDSKNFIKYNIAILEVFINKQLVKEMSKIIILDRKQEEAEKIMHSISSNLHRQQYELHLQVSCNKKIIKSYIIKPFRKDVTAKCYGGDSSRKKKLLKKQNIGKNKLSQRFNISKIKDDLFSNSK